MADTTNGAPNDEQMVAYVQQLVQAANSDDEQTAKQAQQQITIILKAYPILAEMAKRSQQESAMPAAKYGAKIEYLDSLVKGVPEGFDVEYHRAGGSVTKNVVKKSKKETTCAKCGKKLTECKCGGGKATKRYFG